MKCAIQLADHWEDVVAALDLSRPQSRRDDLPAFLRDEEPSRGTAKINPDDMADVVTVKQLVRTILLGVVERLNDFPVWKERAQGLNAAFNTQLAYDVMVPYLRLAAEVTTDYPFENFLRSLLAMTQTVRPSFGTPQLTFDRGDADEGGAEAADGGVLDAT
eukprot:m.4828 g.4828  ORF g.4828 m.4828 type:complete len:161 (-) comp3275_c0_seq1:71-553(-)